MANKPTHPSFYLTTEAYKSLIGGGGWRINEIPLELAAEIKDHFGIDTSFCVFASGAAPLSQNGEAEAPVAGIDWIRREDKPRPLEKPLNVYHYLITGKTAYGYPVFHLGQEDTVAPHWSDLEDLKVYFEACK